MQQIDDAAFEPFQVERLDVNSKSAKGLAQSKTLRVFQESSCRAMAFWTAASPLSLSTPTHFPVPVFRPRTTPGCSRWLETPGINL
jgi:hypothetical protein